jgi:short-subunit dehydrogenase
LLLYLEFFVGESNGLGCIINVASLLGLKGGRGSAGYAASKAGVIGKSLRTR